MQLPAISATALVHPSVMRCGCGHGSAPIHTHTHKYTHIPTSLDSHTPAQHLGNSICRSFCAVAVAAAAAVGKQHFSAFFTYLQIFSFLVFGLLISGPGLDRERTRERERGSTQECAANAVANVVAATDAWELWPFFFFSFCCSFHTQL